MKDTRENKSRNKTATTPECLPQERCSYLLRWESFLFLVMVLVFIANCVNSPYFLDAWNLSDATYNFTEKAMIAFPLTLLIIVGEIDISVASIMALSSVGMGVFSQYGLSTYTLVLIGIMVGGLCGLTNGLMVTLFRIPSIVVTIGTMSLFRGIGYILLSTKVAKQYPKGFEYFGQGYVFWVFSFEFALFSVFALVFYILLHHTHFGRITYAIGNNETASYYSGISVNRHKLILFVLVGLCAGIASVLLTSRLGSTRPSIATGWELGIITIVMLGGVNILGGSGSILGVVIALILMGLLTYGVGLLNIPGIVMSVIVGSMLISVVSLPIFFNMIKSQRWRVK